MHLQFQPASSNFPVGGVSQATPTTQSGTTSGATSITVNKANTTQMPPNVSKASPSIPLVSAKSTVPLGGLGDTLKQINTPQQNSAQSSAIYKPMGSVIQKMADKATSIADAIKDRLGEIKSLPGFLKSATIKHNDTEYVVATTRSGGTVVQPKSEYDRGDKSGLFIGGDGKVIGSDQKCLEALQKGLDLQEKESTIARLKENKNNAFMVSADVGRLADLCKKGVPLSDDDKKLLLSIKADTLANFQVSNMADARLESVVQGAIRTIEELTDTVPPPKVSANTEGPSKLVEKEAPKMDDDSFKSAVSSMKFSDAWTLGRHEEGHLDSMRDKMADSFNTVCGAEVFGANSFVSSSLDHNKLYISLTEGTLSKEEIQKKFGNVEVKDTNPVSGQKIPTLVINEKNFERIKMLASGESLQNILVKELTSKMQGLQYDKYDMGSHAIFSAEAAGVIQLFKGNKQLTEEDKKVLLDIKTSLEKIERLPDITRRGQDIASAQIKNIEEIMGTAPKKLSELEEVVKLKRKDIDKIPGNRRIVAYEGVNFVVEKTVTGGLRIQNQQDWKNSIRSGIFIESNSQDNPNRGKVYDSNPSDRGCLNVLILELNAVSSTPHMH